MSCFLSGRRREGSVDRVEAYANTQEMKQDLDIHAETVSARRGKNPNAIEHECAEYFFHASFGGLILSSRGGREGGRIASQNTAGRGQKSAR